MSIHIRPVQNGERRALEVMTRDAFWDVYRPGCDEHYLIHVLHEKKACAIEMAADLNDQLAGHVMCVPARIQKNNTVLDDVLCLGPLTVDPACQRQGVGTALLQAAIEKAKELRYRAIFLAGNPAYYSRVGFRAISDYGMTLPDGSTFDALMALPLEDGVLDDMQGAVYHEPSIYQMDAKEAEEFDRQFEPRVKHVHPGQLHHPDKE